MCLGEGGLPGLPGERGLDGYPGEKGIAGKWNLSILSPFKRL